MTAISFNGRHFQKDMIVQSIGWYLAYALSFRDIEEMMQERGFSFDHSTIKASAEDHGCEPVGERAPRRRRGTPCHMRRF